MRYSVNREIHFPAKLIVLISFLFAFWALVITLVNVAAQGYETVTILTSDFNGTNWLWYDNFIPASDRSQHRNCTPATLKLDDYLTTTNPHAMYDYQFSGAHVSNIDELLGYGQTHYSNNLLQDCSVQIISMTEYLSPNPVYALNSPATVGCNDAANNFYSVTMYQSDLDNNNLSALLFPGGAANVTQTYTMWATAARQVWLNVFAPNDRVHSVLRPSLLAKNLDSLTIVYFDYYPPPGPLGFNTPASGSWFLEVFWTVQNEVTDNAANIYFVPTLGVDRVLTGDRLAEVSELLNVTIQKVNDQIGPSTDMWTLLNWVYVVQYWSLLYDVGQVQPTLYPTSEGLPSSYIPMEYPNTNNIFVNDTLFEIYGNYFANTILPLLGVFNGSQYSFQALDSTTNLLEPVNVAFFQIYSCTQAQLKKTLSLIISVIVADYTFLNPAFWLIILFGAWYQARKSPRDANWCEGCAAKDFEKANGGEEGSRFLGQTH